MEATAAYAAARLEHVARCILNLWLLPVACAYNICCAIIQLALELQRQWLAKRSAASWGGIQAPGQSKPRRPQYFLPPATQDGRLCIVLDLVRRPGRGMLPSVLRRMSCQARAESVSTGTRPQGTHPPLSHSSLLHTDPVLPGILSAQDETLMTSYRPQDAPAACQGAWPACRTHLMSLPFGPGITDCSTSGKNSTVQKRGPLPASWQSCQANVQQVLCVERPGLHDFLRRLSTFGELVLFTAAVPE